MNPIFFALVSYFCWGIGDIFLTVTTRKLGGLSTTVWSLFLRLIIFSFYLPFTVVYLKELNLSLLLIILAIAIVGLIGMVAFNEGLRVGNAALVGTIAAAFPFITVLLSLIFLKERLTVQQTITIFIIFIGIVLSSLDFKLLKKKKILHKGVGLALIAMFSWGIWFAFIKIPIQKIGWFLPNYIIYASFPLVLLFMRVRKIRLVKPNYQNATIPLIIGALLLGIADFSYNLGIIRANASIIAPIAGSYPTFFVILAFLIFKDKITRQQVLGIVTTLIGIVFLSIFSV